MPFVHSFRFFLFASAIAGCGLEVAGGITAGSDGVTPTAPSPSPPNESGTPTDSGGSEGSITPGADASLDGSNDAAIDTPIPTAQLTMSLSQVPAIVNLTQEGTTDWAHWGQSSTPVRKANVTNVIGALTSTSTISPFDGYLSRVQWSDGAGTQTGDTRWFRFVQGMSSSLVVDVPASPALRTFVIYVGGWGSRGRLDATLGTLSQTDSSLVNGNDFYTG